MFDGPGRPLRLESLPLPAPGPGELVVEVTLATVCGSDLHTIDGRRTEPVPAMPGHEGVGRVLARGGARRVLGEGLAVLRAGGTYVLAGLVHPDSDLAGITAEALIRKCLTLHGVHNYGPRHLAAGLAFLEATAGRFPTRSS